MKLENKPSPCFGVATYKDAKTSLNFLPNFRFTAENNAGYLFD